MKRTKMTRNSQPNKFTLNLVMIIDGNNLLHRAYHKFSRMQANGKGTSMIYGFPFILRSLITHKGPDKVIVVFDSKGKSKHRLDLLPDYKERKQKLGFDKDDFVEQKHEVAGILIAMGIPVVIMDGEEADDLIYLVARKFRKENDILIVSSDKDFNQMVGDHVSIWNPIKKLEITRSNMLYKIGYNPKQCVDYLSMLGDKSDNIPGYHGMGEVKSKDFLKEYSSIKNYLQTGAQYKNIDNKKLEVIGKLNTKLISLKYYYKKYLMDKHVPYLMGMVNPHINTKALGKYSKKYNIN